jgi:hypothetical protein
MFSILYLRIKITLSISFGQLLDISAMLLHLFFVILMVFDNDRYLNNITCTGIKSHSNKFLFILFLASWMSFSFLGNGCFDDPVVVLRKR